MEGKGAIMARMHTRKRGKSGSNKPVREGKPSWVTMDNKEIDQLLVNLKKEGMTKSKVGMVLRDQYGIPKVKEMRGQRVSKILETNGLRDQVPEDLSALLDKATSLNKHVITNPKDIKNRRGLELIEAKIKRLSDYYKRKSKLPPGWSYSRSAAEFNVK